MEIITLKNNTIIMKNNTKMGAQILKHGDFTLTHFAYCDVYSILYKDTPKWVGCFNELFDDELRFYIFEIEPDPNKAAEFIVELYNWLSSQEEAFEKLLDTVYGEEKQKILGEFDEEKQKILGEFDEEKQKILDEFDEEKQKILDEFDEEKQSKDIK